jgi:AcrR family transcriptional regulator
MQANAEPERVDEDPKPLRADAVRNRARLLEAAEAVFAAQGIDVPVDVIAETAGVGVGTLYRHFPTKEKLFEAILVDRVDALTAEARARLADDDPGRAFFDFVEHLVVEASRKRDLITAFAGAGVEFEVVAGSAKRHLEAAMTELLRAAQAAGTVRRDVATPLVLSLVGATCMAADTARADAVRADTSLREMLAVVLDGLRVVPDSATAQRAAR